MICFFQALLHLPHAALVSHRQTAIKAIFLGTRQGDPHSEQLEPFLPTDEGWPPFMRVHPILHWSYAHVWTYLAGQPYCPLYDQVPLCLKNLNRSLLSVFPASSFDPHFTSSPSGLHLTRRNDKYATKQLAQER